MVVILARSQWNSSLVVVFSLGLSPLNTSGEHKVAWKFYWKFDSLQLSFLNPIHPMIGIPYRLGNL
jgi:hypothetical protein